MERISIKKSLKSLAVPPNLSDYEQTRTDFSWAGVQKALDGLADGRGLNIAHEAVDRHADGPLRNHVAMRWLEEGGTVLDFTYGHLRRLTNRFANVLNRLGVSRGDRVCVLADRVPELYISALGTLKHGSVFCPLFSAFGPEPIFQRLNRGNVRMLITTERLYWLKVVGLRRLLPRLRHILLIDAPEHVSGDVWSFQKLMDDASDDFVIPPTDPEDMALLHFTSGTTGMPKGVIHVHQAALVHYITGKYVLDLQPDDIFWCTADPGWVTGTSYGIFAPLLHGVTNVIDQAEFDVSRWFHTLASQQVTVWYTTPTAIRRLMRTDPKSIRKYDLRHLRHICSVGEPLDPEAILWGKKVLGLPIHDTWWQTETGGIMIANYPGTEIRPGSMGRPVPGIEAAIVRCVGYETVEPVAEPGKTGYIALRTGWPSMFRGYINEEARYRKCFSGDWYISGDLARCDANGYFWFVGRTDDIINTAGHLVGPFEVESVLMEHPAVAEVGVIGKPDPMIGEVVKAFVILNAGAAAEEALKRELIGFARKKLGTAIAPREIEFQDNLPKNRAGKVVRRLLKARELGLDEGDTSTLEK